MDAVETKIPSVTERHEWIVAEVKFGRKYLGMVGELVGSGIPSGLGYAPRTVVSNCT